MTPAGSSSDCRTGTCTMVSMPRAQLRHQYGPCLPLMVYPCRVRCMTVGFVFVVILRVRGIWIDSGQELLSLAYSCMCGDYSRGRSLWMVSSTVPSSVIIFIACIIM